tara:strand:- start:1562 stop:2266 length:705 start_codon:yes stop_codon:yes gene_type:complete
MTDNRQVDAARPNLTQTLVDGLGKAIVTGRYSRRAFPTEAEITKTQGVSRSVTREAVKMLTAKGLLSARPRQGTVIQPESSWNLFDPDILRWLVERKPSVELLLRFTDLRAGLEPEAAAIAARLHNPVTLRMIYEGLDAMRAAERGERDELDADIAFHIAILRTTDNPFYNQLGAVVATALRASILITNRAKGHSADIEAHRAVADAIADRRPEDARRAMRSLIDDVRALLERQ